MCPCHLFFSSCYMASLLITSVISPCPKMFILTDASHKVEALARYGRRGNKSRSTKDGGSGIKRSALPESLYFLWISHFFFLFYTLGVDMRLCGLRGSQAYWCVSITLHFFLFLLFILNNLLKTSVLFSFEWDVAAYPFFFFPPQNDPT